MQLVEAIPSQAHTDLIDRLICLEHPSGLLTTDKGNPVIATLGRHHHDALERQGHPGIRAGHKGAVRNHTPALKPLQCSMGQTQRLGTGVPDKSTSIGQAHHRFARVLPFSWPDHPGLGIDQHGQAGR